MASRQGSFIAIAAYFGRERGQYSASGLSFSLGSFSAYLLPLLLHICSLLEINSAHSSPLYTWREGDHAARVARHTTAGVHILSVQHSLLILGTGLKIVARYKGEPEALPIPRRLLAFSWFLCEATGFASSSVAAQKDRPPLRMVVAQTQTTQHQQQQPPRETHGEEGTGATAAALSEGRHSLSTTKAVAASANGLQHASAVSEQPRSHRLPASCLPSVSAPPHSYTNTITTFPSPTSPTSGLHFHTLPPISPTKKTAASNSSQTAKKQQPNLPSLSTQELAHDKTAKGYQRGHRRRQDSKFNDIAGSEHQDQEQEQVNNAILMLARAEVANDLLFNDPKRVVIEHGHLQADETTLRSLTDVSSPTSTKPPNSLLMPLVDLAHSTSSSDQAEETHRPAEDNTSPAVGGDREAGSDGAVKQGAHPCTSSPAHTATDSESDDFEEGRRQQSHSGSDGYKEYPEGDERALPDFILKCATMDELDAVTGAWESAMTQLPDGDFWLSVVSDLSGLQKRAPLHLAAKIRAGIPPRIRGVVWQTLTKARSTYLQTVYTQLIKEYSPHERIIRRDLTRTFPKIPVFKREGGEGQQRLFRILKAYSLYDAEVGYCQGLGFIIGPLMMSMGECEAFCVLVRLMETYDLRGMFTEDMAGLHLRLYQFQILAAEIIPDVMAHLEAHGVLPAMYVPAWFLSLFAYTMPLSFVLRAMDVLMAEGAPESIMRIGISLLRRNAESILRQEDFESTMRVLNSGLYDDEKNPHDRPGFVLQEAAKLSALVTQQRLESLEAQYCKEQGVVLKGRQSMTASRPGNAVDARSSSSSNHAIMSLLGWPWGNNGSGSATNGGSNASSAASTPHPTAGAPPLPNGPAKWKISSLGKSLMMPSSSGSASKDESDVEEYDESRGDAESAVDERSGGRISPRVLELTDAQKLHSRHLREQMLKSLQTQDNAPATILGSVSSLALQASEVKARESADSASAATATTLATSSTPLRNSLDEVESGAGSPLSEQQHPPPQMRHKSKSAATVRTADWKDSSWREEVLEPLQLQLHDARVTCDTHRDALVALQAEHESLQADLALVKMERAELAEQNEQLRMVIRKMETERAKAMEDSASELERMQRSEEALIKARIELAEADEERSLLVRQLNNLRKFVSETTAGGDASVSPINETNAQMHQRRARMMSTDGGVSIPASPTSASAKQGRFSISNFASNWSALRGAIVSPRASMQQDSSSASPASPVLGSNGSDDAVSLMSVAASVASGTPPSLTDKQGKRATIPMASLHRSKTTSAILTTSAMASAELPPLDDAESMSPRVPISGSRQDAWAKLNGGSH